MRVRFDDERVVSDAGIALAATLVARLGLEALVGRFVRLRRDRPDAGNAARKVASLAPLTKRIDAISATTHTPRSEALPRHARSAAVIAVLQQQLAGLADQVPAGPLAGPLRHFAGAAAWAAHNLRAQERATQMRPHIDDLCRQARALVGESDAALPEAGAEEELAAIIQALADAAEHGLLPARRVLAELLEALTVAEEGSPAVATSPDPQSSTPVDGERMTQYLQARFGGDPVAHDVTYVTGGFSKHTILVSATFQGERQEIVVRQVPKGRHEEDLPSEFEVLAHVWEPGLPVPEPLWIEPAHNRLGGPFFVSRRMAGDNLGDVFGASAEVPERFCLDLADFLTHLHRVDPSPIREAPVAPMRTPDEIRSAIDEMAAKAERATGVAPRLAAILGWLRAHVPDTPGPSAIVHGDVGLHNALVDGGRLAALLDWERSHVGSPVEDLAYLRPSLEPVYPWRSFLDRYVAGGGAPPDPAAERFYTVWQDTWRHIECLVLGEDFFDNGGVPMMIAGFVLAPRFLASAQQTAFGGNT